MAKRGNSILPQAYLFSFYLLLSVCEFAQFCCILFLSPFQNQLSGNLLRKFKNSNGWQKLWVVFTNFCMFFYKSHQVTNGFRPETDPPVSMWSSFDHVGRGKVNT